MPTSPTSVMSGPTTAKPDQLAHDHQALVPTEMMANQTNVHTDRVSTDARS
jgi:hypothetical protein